MSILWKPFTLFYVSRIPVQLHPSWLVYPAGIFTGYGWFEAGLRGVFLAFTILLLLADSLLVHEFAHVLTARRFKVGTRRVILIPFGAVAELESPLSAPGEFWMALAGPLASFCIAGMLALAHSLAGVLLRSYSYDLGMVLRLGVTLNLMLGLFNLLPCFPMDGGRILRSLLAILVGRIIPHQPSHAFLLATRITVRYVAWPVALGMMTLTIFWTQIWLHLILFPLLLLAAEIEYWALRTEDRPQDDSLRMIPIASTAPIHSSFGPVVMGAGNVK